MTDQNVPAGMMPFDLTTALAHPERVRTRDGIELSEIVVFETIDAIAIAIGESIYRVNKNGISPSPFSDDNDLFLTAPFTEVLINVYPKGGVSSDYLTLESCIKNRHLGLAHNGTVCKLTIQNGEVIAHETVHRYNAD